MRLSRTERWIVAAAALLAVGAYARSAGFQFVYDDLHIIQNKTVLHSLANWRAILTTTWWGTSLYRPVTEVSFALDWAAGGGDPRLFHVVSILLHAAVTALVYLLARGGLGPVGAGAAAVVFAVHPVHVEAVANLVGQAELLAALFTLSAALAYRADGELAARGDRSWRRWAASFGSLAAAGLALGSKETAFATPGVLLLMDWWEGHRTGEPLRVRFRRHWILWLAVVILSLEWLWIRSGVVGGLAGDHPAPGLEGEGLPGRILVMAPVILQYVRLLFFPARLSADYSPDFLPAEARWTLSGVAGLLVLAGAIGLAVRARHRAPPIAFGLAWIGGTVLVVANLIVPTGVVLAERTLYLPSVGAAILIGWLAAWSEASWRHVGVGLAALCVALGMTRTVTRVPVWVDNNHFFPQLVRDAPGSYRSYWVAGALSYDNGDPVRGEAMLLQGLRVYPLHPQMWETYGYQLEKQQQWLRAAHALQSSFNLDPRRVDGASHAVVAYIRAGMLDSARALVLRLGAAAPRDIRYLAARAEVANAAGRTLEAMSWRRQVAWVQPDVWQHWLVTASLAMDARYCWEARRSISRVRSLKPDAPRLDSLELRLRQSHCER